MARYVAELRPDAADLDRLSVCLLDFVAAVLTGAATSLGRRLVERYATDGPRGYAFVLAYLAEISEFSHGHARSAGHVGSTPLPAVLALAADADRAAVDWSAAALAGYEAFGRVGQALMPELAQWGATSTGFSGSLGAAAAAARAFDMDAEQTNAVLGQALALTPWTPVEAYLAGSTAPAAAVAAATGMLAAELVLLGERGASQVLDDLYWRVVGHSADGVFVRAAGEPLAVHQLYFKPYPACRFTHGAIQAMLDLTGSGISAEDIEHVTVRTTPRGVQVSGFLPSGPESTHVERQFSIRYVVALAALRREISPADVLEPQPVLDREVFDFARRRVTVEADPELACYRTICPTALSARLRDGATVERQIPHAWGCLEAPMTEADVEKKFMRVASPLAGPAAGEWRGEAAELAWPALGRSLRSWLVGRSAYSA